MRTASAASAELREQLREIQDEIAKAEREGAERQRQEQESAAARAAEAARQRAAADVETLRKSIDDRYKINQEYEDRLKRLREAAAAGAITAADRTRLETLALKDRDEALRRLEPRLETNRAAALEAARAIREAERAVNGILQERERLIEQNETAYEKYQRRIERLSSLVVRAENVGSPVPDATIQREAERAMEDLEKAEERVQRGAARTSEAVRDLGLTFSSAFEDAIIKGERLSKVMTAVLADIAKLIARKTITEPLATGVSGLVTSSGASGWLDSIGSWIGGLFRAGGGPVLAGQPYVVGERGPEWFVPDQRGTVIPNGAAPGGTTIQTSISIDARGADAGVEARLRMLSGQIARQASAMTLDAIRRGGAASKVVRG